MTTDANGAAKKSRVTDRIGTKELERIIRGFKQPSEFCNAIKPLLDALGWVGHGRQIVEALPHFSETVDLTALRNALVELNYQSKSLKVPMHRLDQRLLPCLYIPKNYPILVVLAKEGDNFKVYNCITCEEELINGKRLSGVAYIFTNMEEKKTERNINWFTTIMTRFKSLIYQLLIVSLILNLFIIAIPLYIMVVYDQVIASGSLPMLGNFTIGVILALVGTLVLHGVRNKVLAHIGARLDHMVGKVILERLLYLSPGYTESAALGAQVARIKDFDTVRDFFTGPLFSLLFELPFVLLFIIIIYMLGGILVLIPIIMVFIFGLISFFLEPIIQRAVAKTAESSSKRQTFQLETLTNLSTIKYCAAEDIWLDRYRDISASATAKAFDATLLASISNAISDSLMTLSGLAVMAFGVILVFQADMSVGALIAVMMLVWRVVSPIKRVFSSLTRMSQIMTSIRQINILMNIEPERDFNANVHPLERFEGRVEFNRVSFRYRPNLPPALIGVSFKIEPGEVVCVIGRNGSGKSTLLKLIPQLYIPQAGSIFIDGQDIRQQDAIELRQAIAYLPQNTSYFYGTVEQNLRFAAPTAHAIDIVEATINAGCFEDVMSLERRFQTRIKDKGSDSLPAGFQQRLSLARVYLKRAGLMLFDEPGNALDFEADQQFMAMVEKYRKNTTIMIVTHRPGHLKMADRILFLDHGQLLLNGTPQEVLPRIPKDYL